MDKKEYCRLVETTKPKPKIIENAFISFLVGGLIGGLYEAIASSLMKIYEIEPDVILGWTSLIFITAAVTLTGLGVFDKLVSKYKFGLIIPTTGFAHSIASSLLDYKRDGLVTGLGSNMFKLAGSVILYGTISAFVLCLVKVMLYG